MKLIKLLIISLLPLYSFSINSAYTMHGSNNNIKEKHSKEYWNTPEYKNASNIANNHVKIFNAIQHLTVKGIQKIDNMCSLVTLEQLFSTMYADINNKFLNTYDSLYAANNKQESKVFEPGELLSEVLKKLFGIDPKVVFQNLYDIVAQLFKDVFNNQQDINNSVNEILIPGLTSETNFNDFLTQYNIKLTDEEKWIVLLFFVQNVDVTERLSYLQNLLQKTEFNELNPIVQLPIPEGYQSDDNVNPNMTMEGLSSAIQNELRNIPVLKNYNVQNIFLDLGGDITNLKYWYNAVCRNGYVEIGNNTYEVSGAVLYTANCDGTQRLKGNHYMAAKMLSSGQFEIIDSFQDNGKQKMYNEGGKYEELDSLITRAISLEKPYILLPKLVVLRKVNEQEGASQELEGYATKNEVWSKRTDKFFTFMSRIGIMQVLVAIDNQYKEQIKLQTKEDDAEYVQMSLQASIDSILEMDNLHDCETDSKQSKQVKQYIKEFLKNVKNNSYVMNKDSIKTLVDKIAKAWEIQIKQGADKQQPAEEKSIITKLVDTFVQHYQVMEQINSTDKLIALFNNEYNRIQNSEIKTQRTLNMLYCDSQKPEHNNLNTQIQQPDDNTKRNTINKYNVKNNNNTANNIFYRISANKNNSNKNNNSINNISININSINESNINNINNFKKINDNNTKNNTMYSQLKDGIKIKVSEDSGVMLHQNDEIIVFTNPPKDFKPIQVHVDGTNEKGPRLEVSAKNGKFVVSNNNIQSREGMDFCILLYKNNYYLGCYGISNEKFILGYFDDDGDLMQIVLYDKDSAKIRNNTNKNANNINYRISANEKQFNKNNNSINNININNINSFNNTNSNTGYNTINNNSIKNNNIKDESNNTSINNQIDNKDNNKNVFFDKSISNTSQNNRIIEIEKEINELQQDMPNTIDSISESYVNDVMVHVPQNDHDIINKNIKEYITKHVKEKKDLADLLKKTFEEKLGYFYKEYLNYLCDNINARMKEMGMEFDPNFGPDNEVLRDIFYSYLEKYNGILVYFQYDNNTAKSIIDLLKKKDKLNKLKQELKKIQNNNNK